MNPFRLHHLQKSLEVFFTSRQPSDVALSRYFKSNTALGSKDRKWVSTYFYEVIRNYCLLQKVLLDTGRECSSVNLSQLVIEEDIDALQAKYANNLPIQYSVSEDFFSMLMESYSSTQVQQLLSVFLQEAPITIRVNSRKISPKMLLQKWLGIFPGEQVEGFDKAIYFTARYPLQSTKEFHNGYFEFQDLSSQQVAQEVLIQGTDVVLDYCAGAGGKSLVFAEKAATVLLHDVREEALRQAKKRLSRAGSKNFSIITRQQLDKYVGKCHTVVVDVPCSGSGTFRRHPEGKWLLTKNKINRWVALQRRIVYEAQRFVRPQGRLVYITCSILPHENERQKEFFIQEFGWKVEKEIHMLPQPRGGDGMYSVSFLL